MNNVLLGLSSHHAVDLDLLFSKQWLTSEQRLPSHSPLYQLPYRTFPTPENATERLWKLTGFPRMDRYISKTTDWVFAPMETYFPIAKCPVAMTIFDIQAFEPNLAWSQTRKHRWFRYKWGRWVRRAMENSRIVFTISEFSKQRMVSLLGADPHKIVNISCGVEKPFFDIAKTNPNTLARPVDSPYAFMIGGLRQKKGGDHFIAVAERLRKLNSDIKIVIAGSSEPEYAQAARNHPNIVLLGVVPDEDLPRLLRCSLCLLFLSLYEGFGIPPIEAMASGVPAVVSNKASLPEAVGDAGIILNPDDTNKIVETLINLDKDFLLWQSYSQRGQEHAKRYTWSACVEQVVTSLKEFS